MVSSEGEAKAELIKKLHQKVKENLEKRTESYARQANKGRKQMIFKEGDWVWLHMRPERFPNKRRSKLAPRGDGPFRVSKRINDNAYQLELPGEFNVSPTFNVADLEPFDAGEEPVLRAKPSEGGGDDEDIKPLETDVEESIPLVPSGPLTRAKAKAIGKRFDHLTSLIVEHGGQPMEQLEQEEGHGLALITHGPWPLMAHETSASGVFTITPR